MPDPTPELQRHLDDVTAAWRIAAGSADRFRDVVAECIGLDTNPGDDRLIGTLRAMHGLTGPEPTRWRDFLGGQLERLDEAGINRPGGPHA